MFPFLPKAFTLIDCNILYMGDCESNSCRNELCLFWVNCKLNMLLSGNYTLQNKECIRKMTRTGRVHYFYAINIGVFCLACLVWCESSSPPAGDWTLWWLLKDCELFFHRWQQQWDVPALDDHPDVPIWRLWVGGDVLPGRPVPTGHQSGRLAPAHHSDEVWAGLRL